MTYHKKTGTRLGIAIVAVFVALAMLASTAMATSRSDAKVIAATWIHLHCGDHGVYECTGWVRTTLDETGINEKGRAQWKFAGHGGEKLIDTKNPFLPQFQGCTFFGGITNEGRVINAGKICYAEG